MKLPLRLALPVIVILFGAAGIQYLGQSDAAVPERDNLYTSEQKNDSNSPPEDKKVATFDKTTFSIDQADSLWLIVNKQRPLQPETYVPQPLTIPEVKKRSGISGDEEQLRQDASDALQDMFRAASTDGVTLNLQSGFRSHGFQQALYRRYVRLQGQEVADTQSARPGHSEHQTGLAADVGGITRPECNVESCFADTIEGKWVAEHAHAYGFIIRYPSGKTPVTGYIYEPWHLRYVGKELAGELYKQKAATMEEFFGLPAAPHYH